MKEIIKPKEKEVSLDRARSIFGIIRNRENFQNPVETSSIFPPSEITKELRNCEIQAEMARAKTLMQTRCLTRLL
jgi:hypothetical protein